MGLLQFGAAAGRRTPMMRCLRSLIKRIKQIMKIVLISL